MRVEKGWCEICGAEIEVRICCNAFDCGCMGLPVDPPVCSNECHDKLMGNKPTDDMDMGDGLEIESTDYEKDC